jgi:hypothetical protein
MIIRLKQGMRPWQGTLSSCVTYLLIQESPIQTLFSFSLSKAGWSLGWVSALDCEARTIWIAEAHRGDGKRFVVQADEKLTEFVELESTICVSGDAYS